MTTPLPGNSSQVARLMAAPPGFAVGWQETVIVPDPAAGAVWSHTVDGRYSERLVSARWTLTTSAAVADRFGFLDLTDNNGRLVLRCFGGSDLAASAAQAVNLNERFQVTSNYGPPETFGPLPGFLVPPGFTWKATVTAIDAADQQSGITLLVQRFPNDATSIVAGE